MHSNSLNVHNKTLHPMIFPDKQYQYDKFQQHAETTIHPFLSCLFSVIYPPPRNMLHIFLKVMNNSDLGLSVTSAYLILSINNIPHYVLRFIKKNIYFCNHFWALIHFLESIITHFIGITYIYYFNSLFYIQLQNMCFALPFTSDTQHYCHT